LVWTIEYADTALKELRKLDKQAARRVIAFLDERVAQRTDARELGKALSGPLGSRWRYRVGDYRVIANIEDDKVVVLVLHVQHRREAYRRQS
jgi:mRNA interferase RelE/StbE